MNLLPRLRPRSLLRPGHRGGDRPPRPDPGRHGASLPAPPPRRGDGRPSPPTPLGAVLGKTLGVPLFQEQAMQIAIIGAGFTPEEADRLRRALATFKNDRHHPHLPRALPRRAWRRTATPRGLRRALLQPDRGFRRLRLPREPRGELRAPRLCLGLAEVPPPGGLRLRAAQHPADGLLRPGADRARRARARGRGAARSTSTPATGTTCSSRTGAAGWRSASASARSRRCARRTRTGSLPPAATATATSARSGGGPGTPPRLLARCWPRPTPSPARPRPPRALWQVAGDRRRRAAAALRRARGRGGEAGSLPPMTLGEEIVADYTALRLTPPRPPDGAAAATARRHERLGLELSLTSAGFRTGRNSPGGIRPAIILSRSSLKSSRELTVNHVPSTPGRCRTLIPF